MGRARDFDPTRLHAAASAKVSSNQSASIDGIKIAVGKYVEASAAYFWGYKGSADFRIVLQYQNGVMSASSELEGCLKEQYRTPELSATYGLAVEVDFAPGAKSVAEINPVALNFLVGKAAIEVGVKDKGSVPVSLKAQMGIGPSWSPTVVSAGVTVPRSDGKDCIKAELPLWSSGQTKVRELPQRRGNEEANTERRTQERRREEDSSRRHRSMYFMME